MVKYNREKHIKHLHDQWKNISLFVLSVYGILGKEDLIIIANLSRLVAVKMEEPIFHICVLVNGRIKISFAR